VNTYETLATEMAKLVTFKQRAYGNSAKRAAEVFKIFYPDGIRPDQYGDVLLMVRIIDKLSRVSQRKEDGKDLGGESPFRDITGYGLLGIAKDEVDPDWDPLKELEVEEPILKQPIVGFVEGTPLKPGLIAGDATPPETDSNTPVGHGG
jgi:hypothetical protein